jgi:glycosyltransferase involved in cell wall biosynthesis
MQFSHIEYLLAGVVFIQLIYYWVIFSKVAFYKKSNSIGENLIPCSIVVCAHDEEENLKELVPLLLEQDHPEFELIVVEDRSNDDSYEWLLTYKPSASKLKIVKVDHVPGDLNGKKYGLTLGIKAAQYNHIVLTDADCRPASKSWLRQMVSQYKEGTHIVLGYSPYQKGKGILNGFIRFETLWTGVQYLGLALANIPYMGVGRNLSYKKDFFLGNKGFLHHMKITGGDDDLFVNQWANKNNTEVSIGTESSVISIPKKTWSSYLTQKKRHYSVGKLYKAKHKILLGLLYLCNLVFWISVVPVMILNFENYYLWTLIFLRLISFYIVLGLSIKKLGDTSSIWSLLIFDFLLVWFVIISAPGAVLSRRIKWN